MQFSVQINATKEKVWDTLWQDETLRQWAGIIDPGTHLVGDLKLGNQIQFISGNGYGVSSLVKQLTENEFLLLQHNADTQDEGKNTRDNQWTGGSESYRLTEQNHTTKLTVTFDVPPELEDYFQTTYPKALQKIKSLSEN